jgi:hypothetical protein
VRLAAVGSLVWQVRRSRGLACKKQHFLTCDFDKTLRTVVLKISFPQPYLGHFTYDNSVSTADFCQPWKRTDSIEELAQRIVHIRLCHSIGIVNVRYRCGGWSEEVNSCILILSWFIYNLNIV